MVIKWKSEYFTEGKTKYLPKMDIIYGLYMNYIVNIGENRHKLVKIGEKCKIKAVYVYFQSLYREKIMIF